MGGIKASKLYCRTSRADPSQDTVTVCPGRGEALGVSKYPFKTHSSEDVASCPWRKKTTLVDPRDELPSDSLAIAFPVFAVLDGTPRNVGQRIIISRRWATPRTARNHGSCGEQAL